MTKRTEVIVTLKHVPDYMVTRTRAARLLDAPQQTTRKTLRGHTETASKATKKARHSDEGTGASYSDLTSAPVVTFRHSLADSSSQVALQTAFDETQQFPSAPKITERKFLDREITHPGTKSYTAILVVRENGTTPQTFDEEAKDAVYDVAPVYFSSMQSLQKHLDNVRKANSSFSVSGGIMIQERDTDSDAAPTELERISIANQADLERAIFSLTVAKVDPVLAASAAFRM